MSLHPIPGGAVPPQTVTVARAVFPRGNAYLDLRDALGPIFADAQFAGLFAAWTSPLRVEGYDRHVMLQCA